MTYDIVHDAPIHPDDVALFADLCAQARRVAARYGLGLRSLAHLPHDKCNVDTTDRLGDCAVVGPRRGHIRVMLRARTSGPDNRSRWCDEARDPANVRKTLAHELAHLRHARHDESFAELWTELELALADDTSTKDKRGKLIEKLRKMRAASAGEAIAGNENAAEAFAAAVNRLMLAHALSGREVDAATATVDDDDPIVKVRTNPDAYGIKKTGCRVPWQEALARVVARGHLCEFLIHPGSNSVTFVGTRAHATVAEYTYGVLVRSAGVMSRQAHSRFFWDQRRAGSSVKAAAIARHGFRAAWLRAFVDHVGERLEAAIREVAVAYDAQEANDRFDVGSAGVGVASTRALVRIDGARLKVRAYMDDKFLGAGKSRYASALSNRGAYHPEGRARGRAAADALPIGRRAVGSSARKLLKEG